MGTGKVLKNGTNFIDSDHIKTNQLYNSSLLSDAIRKTLFIFRFGTIILLHVLVLIRLLAKHLAGGKNRTTISSYSQLRTQSRLDLASLESKLAVTQQKLQTYTEMENGIDEVVEQVAQSVDSSSPTLAWVDRLEHFCVERSGRSATNPSNWIYLPTLAARRLEHCVKLTKQITQLKSECARLATERDASIQEAKVSPRSFPEKLAYLISLSQSGLKNKFSMLGFIAFISIS